MTGLQTKLDRISQTIEFICAEKRTAQEIRDKIESMDGEEAKIMMPLLANRLYWPNIQKVDKIKKGCLSSHRETLVRECRQFMNAISWRQKNKNVTWKEGDYFACDMQKMDLDEEEIEINKRNKRVYGKPKKKELTELEQVIEIIDKSYRFPGKHRSRCNCYNSNSPK